MEALASEYVAGAEKEKDVSRLIRIYLTYILCLKCEVFLISAKTLLLKNLTLLLGVLINCALRYFHVTNSFTGYFESTERISRREDEHGH